MSSRSVLRRSSPSIHCFPAAQRFYIRQFSTIPPPPESAHSQNNYHDDGKTNILGRIPARLIVSSALAFYLYSFSSSSPDSPHVSFADWSAPASDTSAAAFSRSVLHNGNSESKFLFGGKGTVNYFCWEFLCTDWLYFIHSCSYIGRFYGVMQNHIEGKYSLTTRNESECEALQRR